MAYLDDGSMHEQMVRFATAQLRGGHLPLTRWFPYLGLGSPHFLHYQSLPAMITGGFGLLIGPNSAFRWTLYLLVSLWPLSVYIGARLLGMGRGSAGASAVMSPFLMSATSLGYEPRAYIWVGYGVWTQLWASTTLPIAWGLSWRAVRSGRHFASAVLFISLTIALHFETGYLALIPLLLWPLLSRAGLPVRIGRAALLGGATALCSAWVIIPLIDQRPWAATNEILQSSPLVNGYGAERVLGWLLDGRLLDAGRLPVITVVAGAGLVLAAVRAQREECCRALLVILTACLLISFGRATFGTLVDVIPGSADIFFRRFMMGVQLAALLIAGLGAEWSVQEVGAALHRVSWRRRAGPLLRYPAVLTGLGAAAVLMPAAVQTLKLADHNSSAISYQERADAVQGTQVDRLLALVAHHGDGRVYAGMPTNWGNGFTVGAVPVFKYLESRDVDEVGYTLRTASLMTDPEYFFDERVPGDYAIFGIRYLLLPAERRPPIAARFLAGAGEYRLWQVRDGGYLHAARLVGVLAADRTNVGVRSVGFLRSGLAARGAYPRVAFGMSKSTAGVLPPVVAGPPAGSVVNQTPDLTSGEASATLTMHEPGIAVLSSSFDPGWVARVDGHRVKTIMVSPALVAAALPSGTHRVAFRYRGYSEYPLLLAVGGLTLLALLALDAVRARRIRRGRPAGHEGRPA
ncbi:MAG: hypothetical protein ACYC91_00140 [Solirubrobacteraceae bacterium]